MLMVLLLAWALLLPACSEQPTRGSLARVDLTPAARNSPWPKRSSLIRFPFPGPWRGLAPKVEVLAPEGIGLTDPEGRHALVAEMPCQLDPASFNLVLLDARFLGPGDVALELWRDAELVTSSYPMPTQVSPEPRRFTLALPRLSGNPAAANRLVLKATATVRSMELFSLELMDSPVATALPNPELAPALFAVAGDARRAEGIDEHGALTASVHLPRDARLSFSHAWPPQVRTGNKPPLLLVSLTRGEASLERRFSCADSGSDGSAWSTEDLDLSSLGPGPAQLTLKLMRSAGGTAAAAIAEVQVWSASQPAPTVLLITSDTHRADHLAAAPGSVDLLTPGLDALARRGVLFSDCFATTNVTNPSHTALLTGVHPAETGIHHNNLPLRDGLTTLATAFADAGYLTAAVVSARHLGQPASGLGQGFDRMSWPDPGGERHAPESVGLAQRWLAHSEGKPLFLWLHLFDAHAPYKPSGAWRRQYWPDGKAAFDGGPAAELPDEMPVDLEGLADLAFPLAVYKGEISGLDEALAPLLSEARARSGVVALTADHGESFGAHGIWYTHAGLFPDSLHVPLVLSFPGAPAGALVTAPVGHLDLPATLLDLSGLDPGLLPGRSFAGLARGGSASQAPRFALASHGFSASVSDGRYHLILQLREQQHRQMTSRFERHQVQLYDLLEDPRCERDLSRLQLGQATALRRRLIDWLSSRRALQWGGAALDDPERDEQLRQLGYVEASVDTGSALWTDDGCEHCQPFEAAGQAAGGGGR